MLIYCRAPLLPDSCLFDKYNGKKVSGYDVPHATSVRDDQVYPCCGLFELETWNIHHWGCADFVQPFRQQLLKSEMAFCGICHKNCPSVVDFILHHKWSHLCLPLFVCPVCHFTYITQSCLQMHITEIHGVQAWLNNHFHSIITLKARLLNNSVV